MGERGPQQSPIEHGTRAGYIKHVKRKEEACAACKEANAAAQRVYKKGSTPGAVKDRARARAMSRAHTRMRYYDPITWEAFYQDELRKEPDLNGEG